MMCLLCSGCIIVPGDIGAGVLPDFCQGPPPDLEGSAEGSDMLGRNARANVNCRALGNICR